MLTKLTLTIDDKVVERAKLYATRRHRSISRMVEDYLRAVSEDATNTENTDLVLAPITKSIVGMFSSSNNDQSYEDLLIESLSEKHLK